MTKVRRLAKESTVQIRCGNTWSRDDVGKLPACSRRPRTASSRQHCREEGMRCQCHGVEGLSEGWVAETPPNSSLEGSSAHARDRDPEVRLRQSGVTQSALYGLRSEQDAAPAWAVRGAS